MNPLTVTAGRLILVLAWGALAAAPSAADVVLLRNGSVLEGEVRQTSDGVVLRQSGGELHLATTEVATIVDSLLGAYSWQRQLLGSNATADDHLNLADWAIRQSLWPQAARDLLDARILAPGSARLELLERRLRLLSQPKADSTSTEIVDSPAPQNEQVVEPPSVSLKLPEQGLEEFTRRVQPILVNNCTNGGCHNGGTTDRFALDRRLLYGYADASSTEHNLRTVLASIDIENPDESPLLVAIRGTHAGVITLQGTRAAEWRDRIVGWTNEVVVANRPAMEMAQAIDPTTGEPIVVSSKDVGNEAGSSLEESTSADVTSTKEEYLPLERTPLVRGSQLKKLEPRDEFDPEIFNTKHRRSQDDLPME